MLLNLITSSANSRIPNRQSLLVCTWSSWTFSTCWGIRISSFPPLDGPCITSLSFLFALNIARTPHRTIRPRLASLKTACSDTEHPFHWCSIQAESKIHCDGNPSHQYSIRRALSNTVYLYILQPINRCTCAIRYFRSVLGSWESTSVLYYLKGRLSRSDSIKAPSGKICCGP